MNPARLHAVETTEEKLGSDGQMSDIGMLRRMARDAITTGKLPNRAPDRMWGGAGAGAECAICGAPVGKGEFGVELEFATGAGADLRNHLVHVNCFSALESERKNPRIERNETRVAGRMMSADD
jgi:hypothetical protein